MAKEPVPDFTNCVLDKNGDKWCYDEATETICRVIPVYTAIPQEVCLELLRIATPKREKEK